MYNLRYNPKFNEYEIHSEHDGAFRGSLNKIARKAMMMGIKRSDLLVALDEMDKLEHDVALFGIFGNFLFTKVK